MKFEAKHPPRTFQVGNDVIFDMADCGSMHLESDEQITFLTNTGAEYDVARKDWGYYATPSTNGRLASFNLKTVLVKNVRSGNFFILLVETGKEDLFQAYCQQEFLKVISWLDTSEVCEALEMKVSGS